MGNLLLNAGVPDEPLPLILRPSESLLNGAAGVGRILSEMVSEALECSILEEHRFKIGEHEFCEPDYLQILLWAKALELEPETVLERLMVEPEKPWRQKRKTKFVNGRIIKLGWDIVLLPIVTFEWVEGLVIEEVAFFVPEAPPQRERTLRLPLPELRRLDCNRMGLTSLDLAEVPNLEKLSCYRNNLTELDLTAVPHLIFLQCGHNLLTSLNVSALHQLYDLSCGNNQLRKLDISGLEELHGSSCENNELAELELSNLPQLTELSCEGNELTKLDFAAVPRLTDLRCNHNDFVELDIRTLNHLNVFAFDEEKTRVFQNAAQRRHFNLKAIADSTEAIRLDPQNADAYCNRGDAHSDGYDYDRAIADYSESIRLEPNDARLYLKRLLQYSRKGDYHKALADLREALRLAPEICHQDDHIVVDVGDTPLDIGMRLTETEVRDGEDEYGEGTFTVVKGAEGFRKFIAEGNRFSK